MSLAEKNAQFAADVDIAHQIVHGPATGEDSTVTTAGGEVRTLAKLVADNDAAVNAAGLLGQVNASKDAAAGSAAAAAADRTAAESARDAALIQAGVYVDEPTGRAAVADGVAFKVQGSGDVAAYEYRRVNSGSSTLIATYPSASLISAVANRTATWYYNGAEVARAVVDSAGRAESVTLTDGTVIIPKLALSAPALAEVGELAGTAIDARLRPKNALEALGYAANRRVDLVMIGDSNQLMDGYGFTAGLRKAIATRFGEYATGTNVIGASANGEYQPAFGAGSGAPAGIDAIWPVSALHEYKYVADGATYSGTSNGLIIEAANAIGVNNALRFHFAYGSFDNGAGSFKPGVRLGASPFSLIAESALLNTNTGAYSYQIATVDIPAASRDNPIEAKWYRPGSTVVTGPFAGFFVRAENVGKVNGISAHTLYGSGGQSLYDMATTLLAEPDAKLTRIFTETRRLQLSAGQTPIVVVYINSGLNDRNEALQPSLGWRASTVADSPTAYIDNLEAITKRIEDIWQKNGWSLDELFFLSIPSHPVSAPDDAELIGYRKAAWSWAAGRQRTSFVDFTNLTTSTEMLANDWYKSSGADTNHLTTAGYDTLSTRVAALIPTVA